MTTTENTIIWEEKNLIEVSKNSVNKEISEPNVITNETKKNVTENEWKDTGKVSGIYKIINKVNGKYYVGKTTTIKNRWSQHKNRLKYKSHTNKHLQSAWDKYGESNFEWIIVEEVSIEKLTEIEQKYLDIAKMEQDRCYNKMFISDATEFTDESKQLISNSLKKYYEMYKDGNIKKIRKTTKGFKFSEESRQKMSRSHKGQIPNESTIQKVKLANTGKNNYGYNHTIYHWFNDKNSESFDGTCDEFKKKYNIPHVYCLITKKRKSSKGWKVTA